MLTPLLAALVAVAPEVLFTFDDERVEESSGLVAASSGDAVFTHEDSGTDLSFFTVDLRGRTLARSTFRGQDMRDVEDAALGPGPSLYLADIGDNNAVRRRVLVHRLDEPAIDTTRRDVAVDGEGLTSTSLTYEDGPRDAEALLVHPRTGQVIVVSKEVLGGNVYAAPQPLADGVLRRVGSLSLPSSTTSGGPKIGGVQRVLVTGGAVSPDGRRVALRTYTDAYVFQVPGDDLAAALQGEPLALPLPATPQGEAITWTRDGSALLTSTEGEQAPVHRVPVPAPPSEQAQAADDAPGGTADDPGRAGLDRLARPAALAVFAAAAVLAAGIALGGLRVRRRSRE